MNEEAPSQQSQQSQQSQPNSNNWAEKYGYGQDFDFDWDKDAIEINSQVSSQSILSSIIFTKTTPPSTNIDQDTQENDDHDGDGDNDEFVLGSQPLHNVPKINLNKFGQTGVGRKHLLQRKNIEIEKANQVHNQHQPYSQQQQHKGMRQPTPAAPTNDHANENKVKKNSLVSSGVLCMSYRIFCNT